MCFTLVSWSGEELSYLFTDSSITVGGFFLEVYHLGIACSKASSVWLGMERRANVERRLICAEKEMEMDVCGTFLHTL